MLKWPFVRSFVHCTPSLRSGSQQSRIVVDNDPNGILLPSWERERTCSRRDISEEERHPVVVTQVLSLVHRWLRLTTPWREGRIERKKSERKRGPVRFALFSSSIILATAKEGNERVVSQQREREREKRTQILIWVWSRWYMSQQMCAGREREEKERKRNAASGYKEGTKSVPYFVVTVPGRKGNKKRMKWTRTTTVFIFDPSHSRIGPIFSTRASQRKTELQAMCSQMFLNFWNWTAKKEKGKKKKKGQKKERKKERSKGKERDDDDKGKKTISDMKYYIDDWLLRLPSLLRPFSVLYGTKRRKERSLSLSLFSVLNHSNWH